MIRRRPPCPTSENPDLSVDRPPVPSRAVMFAEQWPPQFNKPGGFGPPQGGFGPPGGYPPPGGFGPPQGGFGPPGGYPPPGGFGPPPEGVRFMGPATPPPNHMVLAILSTVCCGCLPLGVVAIVYASQVNSKWAMGDVAGARAASDNAKMWASISIGIGIVLVILQIVLEVAVHK